MSTSSRPIGARSAPAALRRRRRARAAGRCFTPGMPARTASIRPSTTPFAAMATRRGLAGRRALPWKRKSRHGSKPKISMRRRPRPVASLIAQRIEPTVSLMAVTLVLTILIAVPLGVVAAWKAGSWVDRTIMAFAVFAFSLPVFVVGYVLAYVFALQFEWLPVQGYTPLSAGLWPWLQNLILPALALGSVYIALIARITRASMLEVLQQDYVRTARAKGLGQRNILFVHALKNAAVPIVTVIGIGIALLIGGAVVTESVFAIPGLGRLTIDAILRRDYPVIQGIVLLFSFLYVLVNLMVDLTYTLVDPRIRY